MVEKATIQSRYVSWPKEVFRVFTDFSREDWEDICYLEPGGVKLIDKLSYDDEPQLKIWTTNFINIQISYLYNRGYDVMPYLPLLEPPRKEFYRGK